MAVLVTLVFAAAMIIPLASWAIETTQENISVDTVVEDVEPGEAAKNVDKNPYDAEVDSEGSDESAASIAPPSSEPETPAAADEEVMLLDAPDEDIEARLTQPPTMQPTAEVGFPDDPGSTLEPGVNPTVIFPDGSGSTLDPGASPTVIFPDALPDPTVGGPAPTVLFPTVTPGPNEELPAPTVLFPTVTPDPPAGHPEPTVLFPTVTPYPTAAVPNPTVLLPTAGTGNGAGSGSISDSTNSPQEPEPTLSSLPEKTQAPLLRGANGTASPSNPPAAPKTNDDSKLPFWAVALLVASCIVLVMTVKLGPKKPTRRRRRSA